ncbi:MAG: phosphoribosylamine--glycine ligase [Verrucomicrobia bacterium A1]|nr:MAG: phosphoribosylamine--glycine ligase [Verrucomicrobia bacterium A1]
MPAKRAKILVVGGGGREHALAWKLAGDRAQPELFCAPGNAGTASLGTNLDIAATDIERLVGWARANRPDLTVVGPEAPLCEGLVDRLQAEGLRVFGPTQAAARLEGSKLFAKDVMVAAGVPTAKFARFTDAGAAKAYIRQEGAPIVVKADGLAAGKGVTVAATVEQAEAAVDEALVQKAFGDAGNSVLIEECLQGEEASILGLVDGEHVVLLASAQDHKRVFDRDEGPNTGGMGAYSPAPVVKEALWPVIREQVFERTLRELRKRGITYRGVLYAGLMMTASGPKVLEFNCRFGDPETQAILPRWDGDLAPALEACAAGTLNESLVRWKPDPCVCVVMAAGGYPGHYEKGKPIEGLDRAGALPGVVVFHAGTKSESGCAVTAGGRVLGVTALGGDLRTAVARAYEAAGMIRFDRAHFRKDIAARALHARQ